MTLWLTLIFYLGKFHSYGNIMSVELFLQALAHTPVDAEFHLAFTVYHVPFDSCTWRKSYQ